MSTPNIPPEHAPTDIDYIMTEFAKADTTITPDVMAELNKLSSTQETHQDDSEITRKVRERLTQCNADEISKIREFLEALDKSNISESDKVSITQELKMELADNKDKDIVAILGKCHDVLVQSVNNLHDSLVGIMPSWPSTLH